VTGGLNHPITRFNDELDVKVCGLLNFVTATALAHASQFPLMSLIDVLEAEDAKDFTFTDRGIKWRDHVVATEQIKEARQELLLSCSCSSFEEPIEGLRQLKLI